MDNTFFLWAALIMGLAALGLAVYFARVVLAASQGSPPMIEVSSHIRAAAMAFIKREYTWVAAFVAAMFLLIGFMLDDGWLRALAYLAGALLSAGAGLIGMRIATAANARTTEAARTGGIVKALPLAFRGGAVMGFTVAGLGLLGVALGYLIFIELSGFEVDRGAEIIAAITGIAVQR